MHFYPGHVFLLIRRLLAFTYDAFLLFSVLFVFGAIAVALNHGESVNPRYFLPVIFLVSIVFFAWFWAHGGQTLGMRAWKLKLTGKQTLEVSWKQALLRAGIMLLSGGLGSLWVMFDSEGQSPQEMLSGTRMHRQSKN